jgi:acetolactate synthase, large subunit (EC 2.2.1.6)
MLIWILCQWYFNGTSAYVFDRNDAFQEVDIVGMTRPVTKHNFLVKRVEDLPLIIRQLFI